MIRGAIHSVRNCLLVAFLLHATWTSTSGASSDKSQPGTKLRQAATETTAPIARSSGAAGPSAQPAANARFAFIPLADEAHKGFCFTYEIRHYARVAMTALVAPAAAFRERDAFLVDAAVRRMNIDLSKQIPKETLIDLGRMFGVRYLVCPTLRPGKDESLEATIAIVDAGSGAEVFSETRTGKTGDSSPQAAQRVLLDASLAAADQMIAWLGGKTPVPTAGVTTPKDLQPALDEAEKLLRSWDLGHIARALELATGVIARQPADARAWALAARCYARLAYDTYQYPARFHRECRLRATVAADVARQLAPQDPAVQFAAGQALHASRRLLEAEAIFNSLVENPQFKSETLAELAIIRRKPGLLPPPDPKAETTTGTDVLSYLSGWCKSASGYQEESLATFSRLLNADAENVLVAARHTQMRSGAAHPRMYFQAAACESMLALSQAFNDLIPRLWRLDAKGREMAGAALASLQKALGIAVPAEIREPGDVVQLAKALSVMTDPMRRKLAMAGIDAMAPNNVLFSFMDTYSQLTLAAYPYLADQMQPTTCPLGLSLIDRMRLHDRLIVAGLSQVSWSIRALGWAKEGENFVPAFDKAFPFDEAAQVAIGNHFYEAGSFDLGQVSSFYNKSTQAWPYYIPQIYTRVRWYVPRETPEQVAKRYCNTVTCDLFDPHIKAQIAFGLMDIHQWKDGADFIDQAIQADPYRLDLRRQRLYIERNRTGRQIDRAAIEQLGRDFRDQPGIDIAMARLYYGAGLVAEAERAYAAILDKDPSEQQVFGYLDYLLRLQGKLEEADKRVAQFAFFHDDLRGNAVLRDAAEYYFDRREYDKAAAYLAADHWNALDPWQGDTIVTMGRLKWARGDYEGMRAEFERYQRRYKHWKGAMALANLEAVLGNWNEVLNQANWIIERFPRSTGGYYLKAMYLLHQGDPVAGEKVAIDGLSRLIHDPDAYQLVAAWQFYRGDFNAVVKTCQLAQKYVTGESFGDLDVFECRARLAQGDVDGAEPIIKRLRLQMPLHLSRYYCEALWYLQKRDLAAAQAIIEPDRTYNPRDTQTQTAHGRILLAEGKPDEAIKELRLAADHIHVAWHATEPLFYLAQALAAAGKNDEARVAYEKLLALWPAGYWADQAKAALKK